jgi:hypothetical protein
MFRDHQFTLSLDYSLFCPVLRIQLGMTRKEVESILGKPNIYSNNKIRYRIVDLDLSNSAFLKRYNYPSYYIEAQFFQEKLVKYKFGFDYP